MQQNFDFYDQFEQPQITLLNPDRTELYSLGTIEGGQLEWRYNALSRFRFTAYKTIDEVDNEYYDFLQHRRLISVENIGYFIITDITEGSDGITEFKEIVVDSQEAEFINKKVTVFSGTFEFYDPITPAGTLVGTLLAYVPGWSVGTIDADLWGLYRSFDVSDTTLYEFMMTEVSQAYQAVFYFDTINKTVNARYVPDTPTATDIFLSFDNLIEKTEIKEITSELVTALTVYGGGDLDILTVNPLGTNTIYNFEHFETTDWMSQGLIDALDTWEALIVSNQITYANKLTQLKDENENLRALESELADLTAELVALQGVQGARIQQGLDISSIASQVSSKEAEIVSKNSEITTSEGLIAGYIVDLTAINTTLSFDSNFNDAQLLELNPLIIGSTYQNPNFIQTDIMTNAEIQDMSQNLYDQAIIVLNKIAVPRYEFNISAVNFIFLKEYEEFISQVTLGSTITLELTDGTYISPVLLGIDLDYDDPKNFQMIFGNKFRLGSSSYEFSDLFGDSSNSSIKTSFNSEQWGNWSTSHKSEVTTFIDSALNASLNKLISSTNEEITISEIGLRARTYRPTTDDYDPKQLWLTSNTLAFSRDGFQTASLALGQIAGPSGSAFGLVGEVIVGHIIAGNELTIQNENNTFVVDGAGARLTNATFTLTANANRNKILLDPQNGIKIQKLIGSSYVDQFYVDSSGNVIFKGNLSAATGDFTGTIAAASGNIGGWQIKPTGLFDSRGNYIKSTGDIRLGKLSIHGRTAIFSGDIYADNLQGFIMGPQIGLNQIIPEHIDYLDATKITAGEMLADRIFGGTIRWPGAQLGVSKSGYPELVAQSNISLRVLDANGLPKITLSRLGLVVRGNAKFINDVSFGGAIIADSFYPETTKGKTKDVKLGERILNFKKGILIGLNFDNVDDPSPEQAPLVSYAGKDIPNSDFTDPGIFNGAIFAGANVRYSDFEDASLYGVNFSVVDARDTNFDGAYFGGANLAVSNFSDANFFNTSFNGGDLSHARFDDTNIGAMDCWGVTMLEVHIDDCIGNPTAFTSCTMNGAFFRDVDLSGTTFDGSNLSDGDIRTCNIAGASFRDCNLTGVNFTGSTGSGTANFTNALMTGVIGL